MQRVARARAAGIRDPHGRNAPKRTGGASKRGRLRAEGAGDSKGDYASAAATEASDEAGADAMA